MDTNNLALMLAFAKVGRADVMWAYSGKGGNACCCGCKGTYRYTAAHQDAAGKRRGYAVTNDEVNHAQVAKVLRLAHANPAKLERVAADQVAFEVAGRVYMLGLATEAL